VKPSFFELRSVTNPLFIQSGDIFLTHDSPSVRKSHNEGWKHKVAVKNYYSQFEENQTQSLIDQKVKAFEQKAAGIGLHWFINYALRQR
jgi:hypothetical protein